MNEMKKFVVFGAGSWGTAMAIHLASDSKVFLIPRTKDKASDMILANENSFRLPGFKFPENLEVTTDFEAFLKDCAAIFFACPAKGLVSLCENLSNLIPENVCLVSLIKGVDKQTLKRPSEILSTYFPKNAIACLCGPTYAIEVAQGKPAAMVLASKSDTTWLQSVISNNRVRVYNSNDLCGIELASCLKNIYSLGAGILDGLKLGDNAKAAYLTRALAEMIKIGCAFGGNRETFYGLGGIGDLIATSHGDWSRNRTFGEKFASGEKIETLLQAYTVEGYWSLEAFYKQTEQRGIDAPILNGIYDAIYRNKKLSLIIDNLMLRQLKDEY